MFMISRGNYLMHLPYATGVSLMTVWSGHFKYGSSSVRKKYQNHRLDKRYMNGS